MNLVTSIAGDTLHLPEAAIAVSSPDTVSCGMASQGAAEEMAYWQYPDHESGLKAGIWSQFRRKTRKRAHEQVGLAERESLTSALVSEGKKYEFSDRTSGIVYQASVIAAPAADLICEVWMARPQAHRAALALTNAMACYIFSKYDVRLVGGPESTRKSRYPVKSIVLKEGSYI